MNLKRQLRKVKTMNCFLGTEHLSHMGLIYSSVQCKLLDSGQWAALSNLMNFNNESDFTQLLNLRSRWKLKRFQYPVTKVKEIMVFDWSLKRVRHLMSN